MSTQATLNVANALNLRLFELLFAMYMYKKLIENFDKLLYL